MTQPFRPARAPDARPLGALLAQAFADDPVARWTFGDPRAIAVAYPELAARSYVGFGTSVIAEGHGGAIWVPPGKHAHVGLRASAAIGAAIARYAGPRTLRNVLAMDAALQKHHPSPPHWYLFLVGVVPTARGQGLASRLLRHTLAQADAQRMPAYLENSNPLNTRLYEGLGFRAGDPFYAAPGAPPLVPMWREPLGL